MSMAGIEKVAIEFIQAKEEDVRSKTDDLDDSATPAIEHIKAQEERTDNLVELTTDAPILAAPVLAAVTKSGKRGKKRYLESKTVSDDKNRSTKIIQNNANFLSPFFVLPL